MQLVQDREQELSWFGRGRVPWQQRSPAHPQPSPGVCSGQCAEEPIPEDHGKPEKWWRNPPAPRIRAFSRQFLPRVERGWWRSCVRRSLPPSQPDGGGKGSAPCPQKGGQSQTPLCWMLARVWWLTLVLGGMMRSPFLLDYRVSLDLQRVLLTSGTEV